MYYLVVLTSAAIIISFIADRKKTVQGLRIAGRKFLAIAPSFLVMLILISVVLYLVPDKVIVHYLGAGNRIEAILLASFIGSITLMPGFIAYPLCGILLKRGVAYIVLGAFSTTLMMVGVLTYPVEKSYFGVKITILRNIASFIIALIVAFVIGVAFGEIKW